MYPRAGEEDGPKWVMADIPDWDPAKYGRSARFVSALAGDLMALLDPLPGEKILDLGCGDGALMTELAAVGATVVGTDLSPALATAAHARGLPVYVADAEALPHDGVFDAVFSNAVLHWVPRLDAALTECRRALRPGGRLVVEMGGKGNIQSVFAALEQVMGSYGFSAASLSPWTFPSPDRMERLLTEAGFRITSIALIDRPTPLPGALADWLEIFGNHFYAHLPAEARADAIRETEAAASSLRQADGSWVVDYVRLRFHAVRPDRPRSAR